MTNEAQNDVAVDETVKTRTKKVFTNEEIVALETTVENITPILSEDLAKVAKLVSAWHTEGRKDAIAEVIADFGTEEALKTFVKESLPAELEQLNSIVSVVKVMNSISLVLSKEKAARKQRLKKGGKKITVTIGDKLVQVNAEYFASLEASLSREEKIELIQKHPSYTEVEQGEVL